MYGTIAYLQVKPGMEARLLEQFRLEIPGLVTNYIYRMDANLNTYYAAIIFANKAAYFANANSPEQHARYEVMMESLEKEPEWHDGEIILAKAFEQ